MRAVLLVSALLVFAHPTWATIEFVRVPTGGLQPQAAVDARGALHLIYFKGEPAAGDVFYIRRDPATAAFTPPLRVNSQPNTVIAIGTVRGAHLALGKDGRPHIAWMGAGDATAGMHYARLDDAGQAAWDRNADIIMRLARIDSLQKTDAFPRGCVTIPVEGGTFGMPLEGLIDIEEEKARLEKTLGKLAKEIGGLKGRLNNPKFAESAPEEVVEEARENLAAREEEEATLKAALARLAEIG